MPSLVTVICLCYNHEKFVREAIQSVMDQHYRPIQLIVIDDASIDNSVPAIEECLKLFPEATFIQHHENRGNCRSFNEGLALAKGEMIIDLAADDVLMPQRIARGVQLMEKNPHCGVQFSDAALIDEQGKSIGFHSDKFPHQSIPSGVIFKEVLSRYFINSPTMMMRKSVLDAIGGYDENLAYEDFDFWIRSARMTQYEYIAEPLVKRRILKNSMGYVQYANKSPQLHSTFQVCKKASLLCKTREEFKVLRGRLAYEGRMAMRAGAFSLAVNYLQLWLQSSRR